MPQGGTDGSYRMRIDQSYEQLPKLRRRCRMLYMPFVAAALLKLAWMGLPVLFAPGTTDVTNFAVFGGALACSFAMWLMAAPGSKSERLPPLMACLVLTALTLCLHIYGCGVYYATPPEQRSKHGMEQQLSLHIASLLPGNGEGHNPRAYLVAGAIQYALDGGVALFGGACCLTMFMFVTAKAKSSGNKKRS